jgi:hypothetical protein
VHPLRNGVLGLDKQHLQNDALEIGMSSLK